VQQAEHSVLMLVLLVMMSKQLTASMFDGGLSESVWELPPSPHPIARNKRATTDRRFFMANPLSKGDATVDGFSFCRGSKWRPPL
jgi:hypothetical protein